ncbi:MAG: hypothetical protein J3R72DRAFT_496209 [Linnemannia gamsii]|nr:MAG: hypothetical protein J3R72DRAFT_496209 [Linnemannia gamsii]
MAASDISHTLTPSDTGFSYLPLVHAFGRAMEILICGIGGRVGYSPRDPLRILEDVSPGLAGALARRGLAVKLAYLKAGLEGKHAFWDRLLFDKVRMALGGKVERIMAASAPFSAEVLSFIRVTFCVEILEAYGQTEAPSFQTTRYYHVHKSIVAIAVAIDFGSAIVSAAPLDQGSWCYNPKNEQFWGQASSECCRSNGGHMASDLGHVVRNDPTTVTYPPTTIYLQ